MVRENETAITIRGSWNNGRAEEVLPSRLIRRRDQIDTI